MPGQPIGVAVRAAVAMLPAIVVSLVGATGPLVVLVEVAVAGSRCRSREETPAGLLSLYRLGGGISTLKECAGLRVGLTSSKLKGSRVGGNATRLVIIF